MIFGSSAPSCICHQIVVDYRYHPDLAERLIPMTTTVNTTHTVSDIATDVEKMFYFDMNPLKQVWYDEFQWADQDVSAPVQTALTDVTVKDFDDTYCAVCNTLIGAHLGYDEYADSEFNAWTEVDAALTKDGTVVLLCEDHGEAVRKVTGQDYEV